MPRSVPRWLAAALELLVPDRCLGCGGPRSSRRAPCGLCLPCFARLRRPFRPACSRCGRPLPSVAPTAAALCGACRLDPPPIERLWALWEYRPPLDRVLRGLKFRRLDYLGEELAEVAADRLAAELVARDLIDPVELVVPVPLHWRRRWSRGFNQAERIARPLARRLALGFGQPLTRPVATRAQATLPRRSRLTGPRGAFKVPDPVLVAGRRLLLVDDVTTTGATLRAAAAALLAAGARSVGALAVAAAPAPDHGAGDHDESGYPGSPGTPTGNALHPLDG